MVVVAVHKQANTTMIPCRGLAPRVLLNCNGVSARDGVTITPAAVAYVTRVRQMLHTLAYPVNLHSDYPLAAT